jgi:hypothetical protein
MAEEGQRGTYVDAEDLLSGDDDEYEELDPESAALVRDAPAAGASVTTEGDGDSLPRLRTPSSVPATAHSLEEVAPLLLPATPTRDANSRESRKESHQEASTSAPAAPLPPITQKSSAKSSPTASRKDASSASPTRRYYKPPPPPPPPPKPKPRERHDISAVDPAYLETLETDEAYRTIKGQKVGDRACWASLMYLTLMYLT